MIEAAVTRTEYDSQPRALDMIAKVQSKVIEQFEAELNDMRAGMAAMVADLTATADRERARAARLAHDLDAARRELEAVRAECHAEVEAARQGAARYRDETAAWYLREVNAARDLARSAVEAEAKVREELTATQVRNQEIVDAQMLRIVELKRQLEAARPSVEHTNDETLSKVAHRTGTADVRRQPEPKRNHLAPEFAAIEAALAGSPPIPVAWGRTA